MTVAVPSAAAGCTFEVVGGWVCLLGDGILARACPGVACVSSWGAATLGDGSFTFRETTYARTG